VGEGRRTLGDRRRDTFIPSPVKVAPSNLLDAYIDTALRI
jgi:hypothetical protein